MNLLPSVVETAFGIIAPALSLSYNRCSHFLPLRRLPSIGLGGFLSMLSRLQLGDFRNYRQLDIALSPSLNVILGDNGSGKTSLLEAIYFIGSGGRSCRCGRLARLVRDGAPAATLYAEVVCEEKHHRLGVRRTPGGIDAIKLNGETPKALSEVAGLLPVLALHPTSVELVFGASALRRRFMDWGMFHVEHEFMPVWRTASAALKQRNALLRTGRPNPRELGFWDQQLAQTSDRIEGLRRRYLQALQTGLDTVLSHLAPELKIRVQLQTGLQKDESYADALSRLRQDDIVVRQLLGHRVTGPRVIAGEIDDQEVRHQGQCLRDILGRVRRRTPHGWDEARRHDVVGPESAHGQVRHLVRRVERLDARPVAVNPRAIGHAGPVSGGGGRSQDDGCQGAGSRDGSSQVGGRHG